MEPAGWQIQHVSLLQDNLQGSSEAWKPWKQHLQLLLGQ
jgi:hypothetical protein